MSLTLLPSLPNLRRLVGVSHSRSVYGLSHSFDNILPFAPYSPVNAPDADISFLSSDKVIFRVHRVHLDSHAEGFPPSSLDLPSSHELIPLSETSSTLDLLFQHIYPRSYPCLDEVEFEELGRLAEAAEKYQVYAAMEVCRIHMRCVRITYGVRM